MKINDIDSFEFIIFLIFSRLIQLLSMYRVHFDYLDIILTSTIYPTTMAYFNTILECVNSKGNKCNFKILSTGRYII